MRFIAWNDYNKEIMTRKSPNYLLTDRLDKKTGKLAKAIIRKQAIIIINTDLQTIHEETNHGPF